MNLELITHVPVDQTYDTPLLFVHGSYSGAWVWERHFLPFFAAQGFAAHALSLRGHGLSEGREALGSYRLRDYVADVSSVVEKLDRPPVVIGHSMGGMVVQKYILEHAAPAAVLLAPVPPHGLLGSLMGIAVTNPMLYGELLLAQIMGPRSLAAGALRQALFSSLTEEEEINGYLDQFQLESTAVILDLLGLDLPPSLPTLDLPVLVLGAEHDGFVFPGALDATARTYRTTAEIIPGVAHAMMLGHGWRRVAERILDWLMETSSGFGEASGVSRSHSHASTAAA